MKEEEEEEEEEGFEEWGADFLEQLIQVEEHALSSQLPSSISLPPTTTTKLSYLPPPLQPSQQQQHQDYQNNSISYSPPRELSQRPIEFGINYNNSMTFDGFSNEFSHSAPSTSISNDNARDLEIDRLKRELGRVSKHLTNLEKECFELKKERRKKDDQIKSAYANIEEKDMDVHSRKKTNFGREHGFHSKDVHGISQHPKNAKPLEDQIDKASTSKAIGVQTERSIDFTKIDLNNDLSSHLELSKTLLGIWGSTSEQQLGRNMISKLFMACLTDFQVLFGCMSMNMSSRVQMDYMPGESSSHAALQYHLRSFPTSEAAKVSHLYSVLTKINNGVLQLEALFRSLLDLCDVPNVSILSSSLHILLIFLKYLLSLGTKFGGDNIKIEGLCSGGSLGGQDLFGVVSHETSHVGCSSHGIRSFDLKHLCKKRCWNADTSLLITSVNWVSMFELMLRVAVSNTEECVRLEAVSIMNVILMGTNAYTPREKFGQLPIFESIAQLLKREAGSRVQKEALHLLFLLLNCSKLLSIFFSGCKEAEISDSPNDKKITLTPKGFSSTLEGLAECIACSGYSLQDIELRKRAIIMLAFLASSGKSGFEIMVTCKLPGETNFLMLILQVLVSEMDVEASAEPERSIKARTLLIREALILLNRLVSNPGYSAIALRLLTARRDMAILTIDIANRLSQEDQRHRQSDVKGHVKESEIVELGQVFKKRVFAYLGDKMS
ncbi:protein SENSITIVE TO UV 2-like isoform X1 [Populus nigra]|uniref:protein SENSITIVE TO UV 2-like isoform X1 n=2 Tax=Populus nigra TaxID=3691 RepID=UPI002B26DD1D|nr:protein SENSITIVE TO UV 2-like isoform X1 [Populus nigra]